MSVAVLKIQVWGSSATRSRPVRSKSVCSRFGKSLHVETAGANQGVVSPLFALRRRSTSSVMSGRKNVKMANANERNYSEHRKNHERCVDRCLDLVVFL